LEAGSNVDERRIGGAEVDDDVGISEHGGKLDTQCRGGFRGQLHVLRAFYRLTDGLAHAAGRAGDRDLDHAATRLSLTGANALRKQSSSRPTQAAARRSA